MKGYIKKFSVLSTLVIFVFAISFGVFGFQGIAYDTSNPKGDIFKGRISNWNFDGEEQIEGIAVYDRNCVTGLDGMTNCDAGIRTKEFGVLNFDYTHNMALKPCLSPGQKVAVDIANNNGEATVQRF